MGIRKTLSSLVLLTGILLLPPGLVHARTYASLPPSTSFQSVIQNLQVTYTFDQQAVFKAKVTVPIQTSQANLFISYGDQRIWPYPAEFNQNGDLSYTLDLSRTHLPPYEQVQFWFKIDQSNHQSISSPRAVFTYLDNRFEWNSFESLPFVIHWLETNPNVPQDILSSCQSGLKSASRQVQVEPPDTINIYIYPTQADLASVLPPDSPSWAAGTVILNTSTLLLTIPTGPEWKAELDRQIPHELVHLLQYRLLTEHYYKIPHWLLEGIATNAELSSNENSRQRLKKAYQENKLLPLLNLCTSFPSDPDQAVLAYAQAGSFTTFLQTTFGEAGLQKLITTYAEGADCRIGIQTSFDIPFEELETRWQYQLDDQKILAQAIREILPYIGLLALLIFMIAISIAPLLKKKISKKEKKDE